MMGGTRAATEVTKISCMLTASVSDLEILDEYRRIYSLLLVPDLCMRCVRVFDSSF